jgi:dihydroneopterin aldolase
MLSIHLHNVKFFAYHGLYEEEKIKGNEFEIDVIVNYVEINLPIISINQTINYELVFELIRERMRHPTELLETIAIDIAHKILNDFSLAEEVFLSIKKIQPPIPNFEGKVGVNYSIKRNQLK